MEIVFIGLALSVCCFGIWRYGKPPAAGRVLRFRCSESSQTPRCGSG